MSATLTVPCLFGGDVEIKSMHKTRRTTYEVVVDSYRPVQWGGARNAPTAKTRGTFLVK
jgi:hypothetical protein